MTTRIASSKHPSARTIAAGIASATIIAFVAWSSSGTFASGASYGETPQPALHLPAPAPYVSVAEILPLPEFIPGAGALYIDPANAPVGPWLAYGADGNLAEIVFMVPLSAMQAAESWDDLATGLVNELGVGIDHVDLTYNGGHPGMAEPHYHVRLVLVSADVQERVLNP